jgi:hypothetical protein
MKPRLQLMMFNLWQEVRHRRPIQVNFMNNYDLCLHLKLIVIKSCLIYIKLNLLAAPRLEQVQLSAF